MSGTKKSRLLIFWGALCVSQAFGANLNTADIDRIRNKNVLGAADLQVVDAFVARAVQQVISARDEDFCSIAELRRTIILRKSSAAESAKEQYEEQFIRSMLTYLEQAFKQLQSSPDEPLKNKISLNLMILLDNVQDLRLAPLALQMVNVENALVRYWAVHAVTNPAIIEQLNAAHTSNPPPTDSIAQALRQQIHRESSCEIISLVAKFAGAVNRPVVQELLLDLADLRTEKYRNWQIDCPLLDMEVLHELHNRIIANNRADPEAARRFAQLYSYTIQVYLRSMADDRLLKPAQKQDLVSLLVEVEQRCLDKLAGVPASGNIKTAIEKNKPSTLSAEHDRLLGSAQSPGLLVQALGFDYGQNPDGTRCTAPRQLTEPPGGKTG
jgi:hypothetical protein